MEYLIRDISPELHKALKVKAAKEATTLKAVIVTALEKAVK